MIDLFFSVLAGCGIVVSILATFYVFQFVVERFITETIPVIVQLYVSLRYPHLAVDEENNS